MHSSKPMSDAEVEDQKTKISKMMGNEEAEKVPLPPSLTTQGSQPAPPVPSPLVKWSHDFEFDARKDYEQLYKLLCAKSIFYKALSSQAYNAGGDTKTVGATNKLGNLLFATANQIMDALLKLGNLELRERYNHAKYPYQGWDVVRVTPPSMTGGRVIPVPRGTVSFVLGEEVKKADVEDNPRTPSRSEM